MACPISMPSAEQLTFSCKQDDDCISGFGCRAGTCQKKVDGGGAKDGAGHPDHPADIVTFDVVADVAPRPDHSAPDHLPLADTAGQVCIDTDGDLRGTNCAAGDDCDDSEAEIYDEQLLFADLDQDGYTKSSADIVCIGATIPAGYAEQATPLGDCNDDPDNGGALCSPALAEGLEHGNCEDGLDNNCANGADELDIHCQWWDDNWHRRRKILLDNSSRTTDLVNFPVLIDIDNHTHIENSGRDLRFVDADNTTVLPHEIDHWDRNAISSVWVRVPQIDGSSSTDYIWVYFDGSNADPIEGVWSEGYAAVYHMDGLEDSTGRYDCSNHGTSTIDCQIGNCRFFDGNDYMALGNNLDILQNVPAATLSTWIYAYWPGDGESMLISISVNATGATIASRAALGISDITRVFAGGRALDSAEWQQGDSNKTYLANGEWFHLTAVIDYAHSSVLFYLDGNPYFSETIDFGATSSANTTSTNSALGAEDDGSADFYNGRMDEVRISRRARSADWISAQYQAMTRDGFILIGDVENR